MCPQLRARQPQTRPQQQVQSEEKTFEKPPNGPMQDRLTINILKIDREEFKGTISPIEAKNLIFQEILGLKKTFCMA